MNGVGSRGPVVLWWGRFDPGYARNAVVRSAFEALGWEVRAFRPAVSALGALEARLRATRAGDLVWVPCFRQRDVAAAGDFARRAHVPLVVDPLISAYDKQVGERGKFPPGSRRAHRLLDWERTLLAAADRVVVDTHGHGEYFASVLGVRREALFVVPVGAEESLFRPLPGAAPSPGVEALFFGSFLALQGPRTIVEAARRLRDPRVVVTLLGEGPEHAACVALARGEARVRFEPWIDYAALPARIARATVVLGVFGDTPKAARVIPNKVYQALACARPVITRTAAAYPQELLQAVSPGLAFVPPGDPAALAAAVDAAAARGGAALEAAGADARRIYERWFSAATVRAALARLLASLGLPDAGASAQ